ncbi:hypothetical protein G7054_g7607 [Neopestalotiopsis clavispora]|nr:hypothetical protein G7054_g7607 [Neopestalotiopsis clavispora]
MTTLRVDDLPPSLKEHANDGNEISIFEQWRHDEPLGRLLLQDNHISEYSDLREVITAYTKDALPSSLNVDKCTWQDVCDLAQMAEDEYHREDATSRAQWTRKKGVSLAYNLTPLKSLFPDEYGLSVVAGGLSLILTGVTKIAENRDKIFQFFGVVPAIMAEAEKIYTALPRDAVLDDHMAELRTSVTLGLCGLLRILQPSKKKTVLQRLNLSKNGSRTLHNIAKVTSTAHQIDELQKAVEISKSKFDSCVERLRTKVLLDIHSKSSENLRESKGIRQAQHTTILRLEESMSAVQSDLEDSRKQFAARFDEAERLQAQNSAYMLLQDAFRCGKLLAFIEGDPRLKDLLHRHDLNALCHIYATLICQLSRDVTIICILDEISDFETDDLNWMNETCHVVQQLQRLTHDARNQGAIFKLYMSSSNRTSEIYKYLPEEARISPGSGIFGNAYTTSATLMDDLVDTSREF